MSNYGYGTYGAAMAKIKARANDPVARERWNVVKVRERYDTQIVELKGRQDGRVEWIQNSSNETAAHIVDRINFAIMWANPTLNSGFEKLVRQYAAHLASAASAKEFNGLGQLNAFYKKYSDADSEYQKISWQLETMTARLRHIVGRRDRGVVASRAFLERKQIALTMQRDAAVNWTVHKNYGRKDRYWTPWFLASRGLADELGRLLRETGQGAGMEEAGNTLELDSSLESVSLSLSEPNDNNPKDGSSRPRAEPSERWMRMNDFMRQSKARASARAAAAANATSSSSSSSSSTTSSEISGVLSVGKQVDERDPDHGYTALHYASKQGGEKALECVKLLLHLGADAHKRIPDGRTSLHLAAQYGTRAVLLELLAYGADPDALDNYGCSALDLARQSGNLRTSSVLLNWNRLLPPEEEQQQHRRAEQEQLPPELRATDDEVLSLMSPALRILTDRLDARWVPREASVLDEIAPDGTPLPPEQLEERRRQREQEEKRLREGLDPLVEARLCEKHRWAWVQTTVSFLWFCDALFLSSSLPLFLFSSLPLSFYSF
jgi:hypothetical protein